MSVAMNVAPTATPDAAPASMLAAMTPGFADPVHGAQRTFRVVLEAMSRPGTSVAFPEVAIAGIEPPAPLDRGTAAVLLALLDPETTVHILGACATATVLAYLRFHTGTRVTSSVAAATFTVVDALDLDEATWSSLTLGTDEAPQGGATLVVRVGARPSGGEPEVEALCLQGPGIQHESRIDGNALSSAFWDWRIALQTSLPRGVDLLLVASGVEDIGVVGLPRSTRVSRGS